VTEERTARHRRIVRQPQERAADAVARVRRERGLEHPEDIDVVRVGASYGLSPCVRRLANGEAHLIRAGSRGVVCVDDRAYAEGRWRFPYAHEFGHFMLDLDHDDLARVTSTKKTRARRRVESGASDFAGLFVVPQDMMRARCDVSAPGMREVMSVAGVFGVSPEVAGLRLLQVTRAPRAIAVSRGGRVVWWAETEAFGARVRADRPVPERSPAARAHARWTPDARGEAWAHEAVSAEAVRVQGPDDVVTWLATGPARDSA
jgi:hypothetical protein